MPKQKLKKEQRGVKELIELEWQEIDRLIALIKGEKKAKGSTLGPKERYRYSLALAAHVRRLDKLLWKAGVGKLNEESLAKLLEKVPRRYKAMIFKSVLGRRARTRTIKEA